MHRFTMISATGALATSQALGQMSEGQAPSTVASTSPVVPPASMPAETTNAPLALYGTEDVSAHGGEREHERAWQFSATSYLYMVPDDRDYVAATFTADSDWLHLEGRYNYEDIDTTSVFAGVNFSLGTELLLDATPMLGGVFGGTNGIAPGYAITLAYKQFELYTEGEYLFDLDDSSESFFYSWSEISYYAADWLRVGLVVQRTNAYESDLDIQRGFLVGVAYEMLEFTTYVFNLGWEDPTVVFSIAVTF